MSIPFSLAGGSVLGTEHKRSNRNNQDAFVISSNEHALIAVVCDGCSSGAHHEVGALVGSRLIASALLRYVSRYPNIITPSCWEKARESVLLLLSNLAEGMGGKLTDTIYNYFLFTSLGCVITPSVSVFFAIGDGVFLINEEMITLGPFEYNMPPYLGYAITADAFLEKPELLTFSRVYEIATRDLQQFLIGTDGVTDFLSTNEMKELFSPAIFSNPQTLTRKLQVLNREKTLVDPQNGMFLGHKSGLLRDDTTCIVGVKQKGGEEE